MERIIITTEDLPVANVELKRDLTIKEMLESDAYLWQKEILFNEIQKPLMEIDYSVFKKTKEQKLQAKVAKLNWKKKNVS